MLPGEKDGEQAGAGLNELFYLILLTSNGVLYSVHHRDNPCLFAQRRNHDGGLLHFALVDMRHDSLSTIS